eukprot:5883395-Amphidinium_carterae.1
MIEVTIVMLSCQNVGTYSRGTIDDYKYEFSQYYGFYADSLQLIYNEQVLKDDHHSRTTTLQKEPNFNLLYKHQERTSSS